MPENNEFAREDVFPSWFANRVQDFLSAARTDLRVSLKDSDTVQVVPDTELGIAAIALQGHWRFNTATVQRDHPGGAKGTYVLWAVGTVNKIDESPKPHSDHTDYAFDLRITSGANPSGAGVEIFEKIAEIDWSGTAIETIRQTHASVTGPMILDGALSSSGSSDITWTRDSSGALVAGFKTDSVGANEVIAEGIGTAELAALAVTAAKLAGEAVETAKIKDSAITTSKIGPEAVGNERLAGLAVTAAKLAAEAVETAKIKDLAVTSAKLAVEAITAAKIAIGAVTRSKISGATLQTKRLATGSLASGVYTSIEIVWPSAFADANYTVNATIEEPSPVTDSGLEVSRITAVTASGLAVAIINHSPGARSGIVHATAFHD